MIRQSLALRKIARLLLSAAAVMILPLGAFAQLTAPPDEGGPVVHPNQQPGQQHGPALSSQSQAQNNSQVGAQVKAVLDRMATARLHRAASIEEFREAYHFYATLSGPPEAVFRVEDREIPGPAGGIPIRVYAPRAGAALPVFVFFHGGGFVAGSLDTHDTPLRAVANRCGCLVVSVGYRLAPENRYPAATEDAYAATKWIADHGTEIGADPARIAVGGDGAGGNLAAVVAIMARDRNGPHLTQEVLIYPILDALMGTYSWIVSQDPVIDHDLMTLKWAAYLPNMARQQIPYVSPASAMNLMHLPPTLIVTAAGDPIRDTVQYYVISLMDAGVPVTLLRYENAMHSFFLMGGVLDAARMCIEQTSAILKQSFQAAP